jgi:hypothetical protein
MRLGWVAELPEVIMFNCRSNQFADGGKTTGFFYLLKTNERLFDHVECERRFLEGSLIYHVDVWGLLSLLDELYLTPFKKTSVI